jgi:hypothetical protein
MVYMFLFPPKLMPKLSPQEVVLSGKSLGREVSALMSELMLILKGLVIGWECR